MVGLEPSPHRLANLRNLGESAPVQFGGFEIVPGELSNIVMLKRVLLAKLDGTARTCGASASAAAGFSLPRLLLPNRGLSHSS